MICRFAHFKIATTLQFIQIQSPERSPKFSWSFAELPISSPKPFENTRVPPGVHGAQGAPFSMADSSTFPGTTQLLHSHLERLQPLDLQSLVFASAAVALGIIWGTAGPLGLGEAGFLFPPVDFWNSRYIHQWSQWCGKSRTSTMVSGVLSHASMLRWGCHDWWGAWGAWEQACWFDHNFMGVLLFVYLFTVVAVMQAHDGGFIVSASGVICFTWGLSWCCHGIYHQQWNNTGEKVAGILVP